ncbi:reverse transcriptase domain-containing protein [Tanacetum coccineum]
MLSPEGIKTYPDKTEAVLQLPSPRTIKEVQSLNGKLASLNRFLSKSAEKSLPLFKTLKKCIKKSNFHWTQEVEQAFKQLKQHLSKLPLLVAPKPKEELIVYLSASYEAISAVLMTERGMIQTPVYFISRALQGPELNYTPMEKLVLALVFTTKRLRRYFQAHPIAVISDQPIKQIISRLDVARRLQKWSVMLREHNITYRLKTSVKGQILADFLVEKPGEAPPDTSVVEIPQESWTLFMDGSSCVDGFQFTASNNKAEYEALIAGLRIVRHIGGAQCDVLVEILKEKSIQEEEVATVVEEEGPTWMTLIMEYLKDGTLSGDRKKASKLYIKARQYDLLEGVLYRRMHAGPRSVVAKAMRLGYYWPTMHRDTRDMIRTCNDSGPFSEGPGKVKFLIVAIDYVTKWIEAKAVATITGNQSNGLVERANQSLGEGIKGRLGEGNKNWIEELPHVLWAHHTMIKSSHGDTPFSLTYGTEAVIPVEIGMPTPGDFVYRSNDASHAVDGGKVGPKWEGPYEIIEALGYRAYKLRSTDGMVLPRTWNIANLKKCYL